MKLADYVVTEAGFGADLGAEKIPRHQSCRLSGIEPSAVVVVATVRARSSTTAAAPKAGAGRASLEYLEAGSANLARHVENMQSKFGMPVCVAINAFPHRQPRGAPVPAGPVRPAGRALRAERGVCKRRSGRPGAGRRMLGILENVRCASPIRTTRPWRIRSARYAKTYTARRMWRFPPPQKQLCGAGRGRLWPPARVHRQDAVQLLGRRPLLAAPSGFTMTVRELRLSAGAGFVVVVMGNIMTMPGLPKSPRPRGIDVDENGVISGLF